MQVLILAFAAIVFAFLLVGAVVFVVCAAVKPLRRFALSAALWCAMWGPCVVAWTMVAGLGVLAGSLTAYNHDVTRLRVPHLLPVMGWGFLIAATLSTAAVATFAAWMHQKLARWMTFALFRFYATVVTAGIGSVFGWSISWWLMRDGALRYGLVIWSGVMFLTVVGFGWVAYRRAQELRGGELSLRIAEGRGVTAV